MTTEGGRHAPGRIDRGDRVGVLMIVGGIATWILVSTTLADLAEREITTPDDARPVAHDPPAVGPTAARGVPGWL